MKVQTNVWFSPLSPAHMDWATHFPAFVNPDPSQTNLAGARKLIKDVEVVDIGCGFGGLLVGLAPVLPDTLMVGMNISYLGATIGRAYFEANETNRNGDPCPGNGVSHKPH
jgi:tRNA G46 methylase TrmB